MGAQENIIGIPEEETITHGHFVTNIAWAFADENVRFNFYCVVQPPPEDADRLDGIVRDGDLIEAISLAEEDSVDVLNISIGFDHASQPDKETCSEYNQECAISYASREAVLDGLIIVAAAGNCPPMDSVCCPSLQGEVISVGGVVPRCGQYENQPPGACWIYEEDSERSPEVICSNLGCGPGHMCSDNRINVWWEDNVAALKNKPDILAPVHFPFSTEISATMIEGTSLGTPLISWQIADICQVFKQEEIDIDPTDIRKAIRETGQDMGPQRPVMNGIGAFNQLGEPHGIVFEERTDKDIFDL